MNKQEREYWFDLWIEYLEEEEPMRINLSNEYEELVFRYIDRMNDPVYPDDLERIVKEYITDFNKINSGMPMALCAITDCSWPSLESGDRCDHHRIKG